MPLMPALCLITLLCGTVGGCARSAEVPEPVVPRATLERDITELIRESGVEPESVTCPEDLIGEVSRTTQCEVEASESRDLLAPIVVVTGLDGAEVQWRLDPALTQKQVERQAAELFHQAEARQPDAVSCDSGLLGEAGDTTSCEIRTYDQVLERTITVSEVKGLMMIITSPPIVPRDRLADALLDRLAEQDGDRHSTATCSGDLEGIVGANVECTVGGWLPSQPFRITVVSVSGQRDVVWKYEPAG